MFRIEFVIPMVTGQSIRCQHDFALLKQAIEFYQQCQKLNLLPLAFEIESRNFSLQDMVEELAKRQQGG